MLEIFRLILALALSIGVGYCVFISIFKSDAFALYFKLALSYLLGVGAIVFSMFLLGLAGIGFNFFSPLLLCLPFCIFALVRKRPKFKSSLDLSVLRSLNFWEISLVVLIALRLVYIFSQALLIPIYSWDAFATWAYRAKVFYFDGLMDFSKGANSYPHTSYPNLIPLLECWLYNAMGIFDDRLVKIIFPLFYTSFIVVFYFFLRRFSERIYGLLGVYLLSTMPFLTFHSTISYSDMPLMTYNILSIMALVLWIESKENPYLILGGIAAGLAAFTKLEGTAYMFILIALLFLYILKTKLFDKNKPSFSIMSFCAFLVPACVIGLPYTIYKKAMGIANERLPIDFSVESLKRIPDIIRHFNHSMFFVGNWNLIWFMLAVAILFNLKRLREQKIAFLLITLCAYLALYFSLFLLTKNYEFLSPGTLLNRSFLQFIPLSVLIIIATFFKPRPDPKKITR
ncbi:MAG: glycosyltransferase family 39 protein [Candidatus Omnitrophica bacterium]|nr:glycosyltransferase family 39 protein [Candidatus Omnitrophota bacterium]